MGKGTKNIQVEVSPECWKKLKILSISRDTTLHEIVREILEKHAQKKSINLEATEET